MSKQLVINEPSLEQPDTRPNPPSLTVGSLTPLNLISIALENHAAIDVIERLSALQEKAVARDAEMQFNEAMNAAQSELGRVAPDLDNPQTKSKYASYAALDRKIRPIYTKHGFSLSFDSGDSPLPDTVRVICYVSHRGGHTRKYTGPPMPSDGKGAKGGDVMTKTHATGAAMSYGARYLLKYIFNIAVGEEDTDGNTPGGTRAPEGEPSSYTKTNSSQHVVALDSTLGSTLEILPEPP
jgi:ERF superfamily